VVQRGEGIEPGLKRSLISNSPGTEKKAKYGIHSTGKFIVRN
jgi:hypothetical protein